MNNDGEVPTFAVTRIFFVFHWLLSTVPTPEHENDQKQPGFIKKVQYERGKHMKVNIVKNQPAVTS